MGGYEELLLLDVAWDAFLELLCQVLRQTLLKREAMVTLLLLPPLPEWLAPLLRVELLC